MPFLEPCNKPVSDDGNYRDFTWYGDATWEGVSQWNNVATFNSEVRLGNITYVNDESQLPIAIIDGFEHFVLIQGLWYFNKEPFILTRPIYISLPTGGTFNLTANFAYVDAFGSGKAALSADLPSVGGQTSFCRISDSLIVWGVPAVFPSPPAFSFTSTTGDGFILFEYLSIAGFSSPSLTDNIGTTSFNFVQRMEQVSSCATLISL